MSIGSKRGETVGFLEFIRHLFDLILSGSSPEADKRRRLRDISVQLRGMNPPYVDSLSGKVLPGFATVLFRLYRAVVPLKQIISKTIYHEDVKLAQRFWDYLVEVRLPESYREKRQQYSYEQIKKRIVSSPDAKTELRRINNEIDELLDIVSDIDGASFNDGCNNLVRLANVVQFNFNELLTHFDQNFNETDQDYKPSFINVEGKEVLTQIMDFYYIAADLQVSEEVGLNLANLLMRFRGSKAESFRETIKRSLQIARDTLERYVPATVLANLIRVISNDPDLDPKREQQNRDYIADFKTGFRWRADRSTERVTRELGESLIALDLSALFGQAELLDLESYNEEINNLLLQNELEGFTHIKGMQIVKSFTVMKFEHDLKDVVNKILVDGFFEDKAFQQSLSASVFECENALSSIIELERGLQDEEKLSVREIKKQLTLLKHGKNVSGRLNKMVDAIDTKAGKIVETATNSYLKLHLIILELLNDHRSRAPVHVSNIKVLGGNRNSEMMKLLVDRERDINRFINIMKNFTVVQTQVLTQKQDQTEA